MTADTAPFLLLECLATGTALAMLGDGEMVVTFPPEFPGGPERAYRVEPAALADLERRNWVEIVDVDGDPYKVVITQTGRYWLGKFVKRGRK